MFRDLAPALAALGELVQRSNELLNGSESTFTLRVVAGFDKGSFDIKEFEAVEAPEELVASGYLNLRQQVEHELLLRVKDCPPEFFERLVVKLLTGQGRTRADDRSRLPQAPKPAATPPCKKSCCIPLAGASSRTGSE